MPPQRLRFLTPFGPKLGLDFNQSGFEYCLVLFFLELGDFVFVCLFIVVVVFFFHIPPPTNFARVPPRVTVNCYVLSSYVCAMLLAVSVL